ALRRVRTIRTGPGSGPVSNALASGAVIVTTGVTNGVREKSSTARPSAAPGAKSEASHRSQKVPPTGIFRPVIVNVIAVRFGALLPTSAPTVPATTGDEKSSPSKSVHIPVPRDVASVLSWKSRRSAARPTVFCPSRHISPVYAIANDVTTLPVLFVNWAPIRGVRLPLSRVPNARSELPLAPKLYVSPVLPEPVPAV